MEVKNEDVNVNICFCFRSLAHLVSSQHIQVLCGYSFSISVLPGQRGDRAVEQFGAQLRQHEPIEATLSVTRQISTIVLAALCKLQLAEKLGTEGNAFKEWALDDLVAYGKYAYSAEDNLFHPILTNGTRLTGLVLEKDGYYGKKGTALQAMNADSLMLWAYAKGYAVTNETFLWDMTRYIAQGNDLGDIGYDPQAEPELNMRTTSADPYVIFALLDLYDKTNRCAFLHLAEIIGDNIVQHRFHDGFFRSSPAHLWIKFDRIEPLALLHLANMLQGNAVTLPIYPGSRSFFAAHYDGRGHQNDNRLLYQSVYVDEKEK